MREKTLVVIAGPTASGKTGLAIELAESLNTSVVSADSRQFYRELAIGSAFPGPEELSRVPHYFIGSRSVHDPYDVGRYEQDALELLDVLFGKNDVVVMAGGSGLYLRAVIQGLDRFPDIAPGIRENLNAIYLENGIEALRQQLAAADPGYYAQADLNNPQRLIRALEVSLGTGKPFSSYRLQAYTDRPFRIFMAGIDWPRTVLYERIGKRVDRMVAEGLENEARELYPFRELNALQTVGYTEFFRYFEGKYSLEEAISEVKKNTRRYAKRQLTWFRREGRMHWYPAEELPVIAAAIRRQIQ